MSTEEPPRSCSAVAEQLVLDLVNPEPPSFANFVAGANREAVAALAALAGGASRETGLLIWGGPGVGKSHLLAACAAARREAGRQVVTCISPQALPEADIPSSALLVVDDVDRAEPVGQARLFTLVNQLTAGGGHWLAAASAPPARLALREDLRTRLALGLVLEIAPLADIDKPRALAAYARERGFRLSDDVIEYLLAHGRRDMTSLVTALAALDRRSLATKRSITVPMLREWFQRDLGLGR